MNDIMLKSTPFKLIDGLRSLNYKRKQRKADPYYFDPCGLVLFTGFQGAGKTLSAVNYIIQLTKKYPHSIMYSNVHIEKQFLPENYDVRKFTGEKDLHVQNGTKGIIYFIDEIQLYFGADPKSKYHIDQDILMEFCQQRKQRKHVIGTTQVYCRLVKSLREQIADVILCNCFAGIFQSNTLIDGTTADEVDGKLKYEKEKRYYFWHTPELYSAYDTYEKIIPEY